MNRAELQQLYRRIGVIYSKAPLKPDELVEFEVLYKNYDYNTINNALTEYAGTNTYAPKPAQLIQLSKQNKESKQYDSKNQRLRQEFVEGERVYDCPYCRDRKYVLQEEFVCISEDTGKEIYRETAYKCYCQHSMPEMAKERHEKNGWRFDFDKQHWTKKPIEPVQEEWVGENLSLDNLNNTFSEQMQESEIF